MLKKKAASTMQIIAIVGAIVSILVISAFIINFSSVTEGFANDKLCSSILDPFSSVFNQDIVESQRGLLSLHSIENIKKVCERNDVELNKNDYSDTIRAIESCWNKGKSGTNILIAEGEGTSFCLYCGSIEAQDDIENFGKKLQESIDKNKKIKNHLMEQSNDSRKVLNVNKQILDPKKLPKAISSEDKLDLFYFIRKPVECSALKDIDGGLTGIFKDKYCTDEEDPEIFAGVHIRNNIDKEEGIFEIKVSEDKFFECSPIFPYTKEEKKELNRELNEN